MTIPENYPDGDCPVSDNLPFEWWIAATFSCQPWENAFVVLVCSQPK
jgi:hypothetical protein